MPNVNQTVTRLRAVPMTVAALMQRPMPEVHNYEADVLPLIRLWGEYQEGFTHLLQQVPGNFYAVANFNLRHVEPGWCRQKLNFFDMKIGRLLLGKHWSRTPGLDRPSWIAVPEMATYLHYNMVWDVPIEHQENFFLNAPDIWRQVVPSGQFHLQVIGETKEDHAAASGYSAKAFHPRWTIDNTITSTELRRNK